MNQHVARIEKLAVKAELGTLLTFKDLSVAAGLDIRTKRSLIACANRYLLRHHDRCLTNVYGKGYRVDPADHARSADLKELGIAKDFVITEVSQLDDGKGGSPALLVQYKESNENAVDSAVVNHLLGKRKP